MRNRTLGTAVFVTMLAGTVGSIAGCDRNSKTEEAAEEIKDEIDDAADAVERKAKEAREEIEDEIDDAN